LIELFRVVRRKSFFLRLAERPISPAFGRHTRQCARVRNATLRQGPASSADCDRRPAALPPMSTELTPDKYRAHYLAADIAQCRVALLVLIAPIAPYLYLDYVLLGTSQTFYALLAVRGAFVAYTLWVLRRLRSVAQPRELDLHVTLWAFVGAAMVIYANLTRPTDYFGHYIVDVWIVLTFYAALPLPTLLKQAPGFAFVAASIALLFVHKVEWTLLDSANAMLMLLLSLGTGTVVSARIHDYRRNTLQARLEAEHRANTDVLTGLANRRAFMQAAAIECERHERRAEPLSLILFDLDRFKEINDTHGHEAGDAVLAECAGRLTRVLRGYDLCARIGGEEFCVVMPDTPLETAVATAERIRQTLAVAPVHYSGARISMSASFGVAQWLLGDRSIEAALARADTALYQAKRAGRDRVVANKTPFVPGSGAGSAARKR
jgi:diguanylate cyclase (GGDEF)-like protein